MVALVPVAAARADGDPASDVLATQPLYLPADAGAAAQQQAELGALVAAAGRAGYPIRVAVIASKADLGAVGELWRRPADYARFLGQELWLVYRGPLLIVMPDGFGLYRAGSTAPRAIGVPGASLARAALTAIGRLAAASGYSLPPPSSIGRPSAAPSRSDPVAWLVFALGALAIAAAWTASLRARPLRGDRAD